MHAVLIIFNVNCAFASSSFVYKYRDFTVQHSMTVKDVESVGNNLVAQKA